MAKDVEGGEHDMEHVGDEEDRGKKARKLEVEPTGAAPMGYRLVLSNGV